MNASIKGTLSISCAASPLQFQWQNLKNQYILGPGFVSISPGANSNISFQIKDIEPKIKFFNEQDISNIELANVKTIIAYLCQNQINWEICQ